MSHKKNQVAVNITYQVSCRKKREEEEITTTTQKKAR